VAEPTGPRTGWRRLRDLPDDSPRKTVIVTLAVCLFCSALVAGSVVWLRPHQLAHREREREARLLALAAAVPGLEGMVSGLGEAEVTARVVDLDTGRAAEGIDPDTFDAQEEARDPERSRELDPEVDLARIGRRPRHATVYMVRERGDLRLIVLPVYGAGYASTLRGFLALAADTNTIRGIGIYEQGETPGIGDQVQDPAWLAHWPGKLLRDETGALRIRVAKERIDPRDPEASFAVEGISGATRTGAGVTRIVRFWTGPLGFGPFLARIREEES